MGDLPCRQIKPNTAVNNLFSHHGGSQQGRKRGAQAAVGQDSGLKPNLPVQATVKYETVLNFQTAKRAASKSRQRCSYVPTG